MTELDNNIIALILGILVGFIFIKIISFQHIIIINK